MVHRLKSLSLYIFLGLLAYMPLHIFLSTWLGTTFNVLDFAKIAKEFVLAIGLLTALAASWKQPWFRKLLNDKLLWLIAAYGLLTVGLALVRPTDPDAELLGIAYNLRFLAFFAYALLLARLFDARTVIKKSLSIILASATLVLAFGVIQYTALPNDALEHVGYTRSNGVLPVFLIDDKPDLERIMSTIRDPNSLGSYILIILSLALALLVRRKAPRQMLLGLLALGGMCLVFTFSRSAWLGFGVAVATLLVLQYGAKLWSPAMRKFTLAAVAAALLAAVALYPLRNTYFAQNVVFHADDSTVLENPNQLRMRFWRESIEDLKHDPVGSGPGTAGLASVRNDRQGVELNENYYLQIASEVGVTGLAIFLGILGWVAMRLARHGSALALGLLAGLAGLMVTNFLVHIWANEAVAYTWWGLAGLVLASPVAAKTAIMGKQNQSKKEV